MILGITGGSGGGKTTLLALLEQQGVLILDCDAIYHALLQSDPALLAAIAARFPGSVEDGILQRKKLGELVFSDPAALQELNRITHAAVRAEVQRRLASTPGHAAIDAIGLFEGELAQLCDVTVAVCAPLDARIARLMRREGISREYAQKRIAAQPDEAVFRQRCDVVLINDGTIAEFQAKCLAFFRQIGII